MHYHCEIILPPVLLEEIEGVIDQVMAPFSEHNEDRSNPFWDFYNIGGRWSGCKIVDYLDKEKLEQFYVRLKENKVTVSGLQFGKQEISPATQIPMVDAIWKEVFPDLNFKACPLFQHGGQGLEGDIMHLKDIHPKTTASRVIIVAADRDRSDTYRATEMFETEYWNGVSWNKSRWNGKLATALKMIRQRNKNMSPAYKERVLPQDDWWVVTIDYHS